MHYSERVFRDVNDIVGHVQSHVPSFYFASQTSMVIPYERIRSLLEELPGRAEYCLGNLSQLPAKIELLEDGVLHVQGPVTWKDAKAFARSRGREVMTSPTEELAAVLSGVATSATGERCFGFGTLREQLVEVGYIDHAGEKRLLRADRPLSQHEYFRDPEARKLLDAYQAQYAPYNSFKNAPFPRLEFETDLMTGTEGQLGVIVEAKIKTAPAHDISYIFVNLPKWEKDDGPHLELLAAVQEFREEIYACELIDENSLSYIPVEERPAEGKDLIYLEVDDAQFDRVYNELLVKLSSVSESEFYQVPNQQCRELRMNVPRRIFETNAKMGVSKKGTDVQVRTEQMRDLFAVYREWTAGEVPYNLFGHFGDSHLHFNFMPRPDQVESCQEILHKLYDRVSEWKGSPFAEHGVGLLKRPFIRPFYGESQVAMFAYLKQTMDPNNVFFPQGYMSA